MLGIRRREFIALGGAAAAWPFAARGQKTAVPVIGLLDSADGGRSQTMEAFRQALNQSGYVEGWNLAIESRSAEGRYDLLPALAADLVSRPVDVVFASAIPAARAAKAATKTIPIVFVVGGDPVEEGLVARLNQPEGNLTGATAILGEVTAKRLQMLHELVPAANHHRRTPQPEQPQCRVPVAGIARSSALAPAADSSVQCNQRARF